MDCRLLRPFALLAVLLLAGCDGGEMRVFDVSCWFHGRHYEDGECWDCEDDCHDCCCEGGVVWQDQIDCWPEPDPVIHPAPGDAQFPVLWGEEEFDSDDGTDAGSDSTNGVDRESWLDCETSSPSGEPGSTVIEGCFCVVGGQEFCCGGIGEGVRISCLGGKWRRAFDSLCGDWSVCVDGGMDGRADADSGVCGPPWEAPPTIIECIH